MGISKSIKKKERKKKGLLNQTTAALAKRKQDSEFCHHFMSIKQPVAEGGIITPSVPPNPLPLPSSSLLSLPTVAKNSHGDARNVVRGRSEAAVIGVHDVAGLEWRCP